MKSMNVFPTLAPLLPHPTPTQKKTASLLCHCALCKVYKGKGSFQGKTLRLRQRRRLAKSLTSCQW